MKRERKSANVITHATLHSYKNWSKSTAMREQIGTKSRSNETKHRAEHQIPLTDTPHNNPSVLRNSYHSANRQMPTLQYYPQEDTWYEKTWKLVPANQRQQIATASSWVSSASSTAWNWGSAATWIVATTAIVVIVPLGLRNDLEAIRYGL